jgi:hypothetical protein
MRRMPGRRKIQQSQPVQTTVHGRMAWDVLRDGGKGREAEQRRCNARAGEICFYRPIPKATPQLNPESSRMHTNKDEYVRGSGKLFGVLADPVARPATRSRPLRAQRT